MNYPFLLIPIKLKALEFLEILVLEREKR